MREKDFGGRKTEDLTCSNPRNKGKIKYKKINKNLLLFQLILIEFILFTRLKGSKYQPSLSPFRDIWSRTVRFAADAARTRLPN